MNNILTAVSKMGRLAGLASIFVAIAATNPTTYAQNVTSIFDVSGAGLDGWVLGNSDPNSTLTYETSGGNPGGYILFNDGAQGSWDAFSAPAIFLGNDSAFEDGLLSFDLLHSAPGDWMSSNPIMITDGSGDSLSLVITSPVINQWTSYSFALNTSAGWLFNGGTATQSEIETVLGNVTSLTLPADMHNGGETTGLDNVSLQAVPEPAASILVFAGLLAIPLGRRFSRKPA